MPTDAEILTALRRSEQALCQQLAQGESLAFGVAYASQSFPAVPDANQLRDVWLADVGGEIAYDQTEAYYSARGLVCGKWTPASGQAVEPVEELLVGRKGWRHVDHVAMGRSDWRGADGTIDPSARVLPARAMPKAYRQSLEESTGDASAVAAAIERLNDANYDAFVAMLDGRPVGRVGYLEVGDVARLTEMFVSPAFRRRGIGRAMMVHLVQLARRLMPKAVVAAVNVDDEAGAAFLQSAGFSIAGRLTHFVRPT